MARRKFPRLDQLVREGVDLEDLNDLAEEEQCPSTRTDAQKVTPGRSSERAARGRKLRKRDVENARDFKTRQSEQPGGESSSWKPSGRSGSRFPRSSE